MSAPTQSLEELADCRCPDCERMTRAIVVGERVAELEELIAKWYPHGGGPTLSVEWPSAKGVEA